MSEHREPSERMPGLPIERRAYEAGVQRCIHCGLCLPSCPTYVETGREADSPRGRIYLMKALADGRFEPRADIVEHLDLCLNCRACEPACPSGVVYHDLIEQTRAQLEAAPRVGAGRGDSASQTQGPAGGAPSADDDDAGPAPHRSPPSGGWRRERHWGDRLGRWALFHVMTRPRRLTLALLPVKLLHRLGLWRPIARRLGARLPGVIGRMQRLAPVAGPLVPRRHVGRFPALSQRRATVGFFPGCVGSVVHSDIDRKAIDLLRLGGAEVIVPPASRCCGAIHHHAAAPDEAKQLARRNIEAFADADRIVTDIAGCGAMLKQYGALLREDARWADRAAAFAAKTRDIHEALSELTLPAPKHRVSTTATYHEACHLVHAQGVSAEPRALLHSVPGVEWRTLEEATICCGAAGSYNLEQPEMADRLGERKAGAIEATGAAACLTANVGCAMQIRATLAQRGTGVVVAHPVELLHAAHFGSTWPPAQR